MRQLKLHRNAVTTLQKIILSPAEYLIIHYACEGLAEIHDNHSPRITTIAIYSLKSSDTSIFSFDKSAEILGIPLDDIPDNKYDELEFHMLSAYKEFLHKNEDKIFIHWGMCSMTYGFFAIEHRYAVLAHKFNQEDNLFKIAGDHKINLSDLLGEKYSNHYIENPRMEKILDFNALKPQFFLSGQNEATAFANKDFVKLRASTSCKVRAFYWLLVAAADNTLKTKATWQQIYGASPQAIWEYLNRKWYTSLLMSLMSLIIGAIIGAYISKYYF